MPDSIHCLIATEDHKGERLDKYLATQLSFLSRTQLKALILEGQVVSQGMQLQDPAFLVSSGMEITIHIPPPKPSHLAPTDLPLDIIFEDEHLLVINKQAGLTVHPGAGNFNDTLVNALLAHCGDSLSGIGGVERPGIVHRLDKETSGLMIVAKTNSAHHALAAQLEERTLRRVYEAICWGVPSLTHGTVDTQIGRSSRNRQKMTVLRSGGKRAITHYAVTHSWDHKMASIIECTLQTGRTHQIRVHMTHLGHGLIGDPLYGSFHRKILPYLSEEGAAYVKGFSRQALHAKMIGFVHPESGEEMQFLVGCPEDMQKLKEALSFKAT